MQKERFKLIPEVYLILVKDENSFAYFEDFNNKLVALDTSF